MQYESNARTIYSWATANNDLDIPLRSPASQKIYDDKVAQAEIEVEADRVVDKEKRASLNKFVRENRSDVESFWENASPAERTELLNQVSANSVMGQYTPKQIKLNINKDKLEDLPSNTTQFLVRWMPDNWANFRDSNNGVNTTEAQNRYKLADAAGFKWKKAPFKGYAWFNQDDQMVTEASSREDDKSKIYQLNKDYLDQKSQGDGSDPVPTDFLEMQRIDKIYGYSSKQKIDSAIDSMKDGTEEKRLHQMYRAKFGDAIERTRRNPRDAYESKGLETMDDDRVFFENPFDLDPDFISQTDKNDYPNSGPVAESKRVSDRAKPIRQLYWADNGSDLAEAAHVPFLSDAEQDAEAMRSYLGIFVAGDTSSSVHAFVKNNPYTIESIGTAENFDSVAQKEYATTWKKTYLEGDPENTMSYNYETSPTTELYKEGFRSGNVTRLSEIQNVVNNLDDGVGILAGLREAQEAAIQTVRMGIFGERMAAPLAKYILRKDYVFEPSASRIKLLIDYVGQIGATAQGPTFELLNVNSPRWPSNILEYTPSEQVWVDVTLLADKKIKYKGDFSYPTAAFIEEVNSNTRQTEESFGLEAQTEETLAADSEQAATAATEQAAKTKTLSDRAKADAEVGGFMLTGSNAPADVAVAQGQDDMFDADSNGTGQSSPNGELRFSKSAILAPNAKPKGVTEAQIQMRVDAFLAKYKGADDVRVWIRDTQDNAFGPGSTAKDGPIKGGYYPEQDAVVFIAENIDSVQAIDSTIQHELLVHKGLGLFEAKDVQGLIDVINSNAPKSKALGKIWGEVQEKYEDKSIEVQAEELIARVAEKKMSKPDKYWNKIVTFIRDMLRKIGFVKEISFSDLRKRVYDMGAAFAEGRRAETREGFTAKTNETKSPSLDGLSGSERFDMKKGGRPDKKVKVKPGDGTADVTIYGVNADGKRVLVAKARKGGWDIVVDRRADGEMFTDGKPRKYTADNRKGVANRIESLGLTLEENINQVPTGSTRSIKRSRFILHGLVHLV